MPIDATIPSANRVAKGSSEASIDHVNIAMRAMPWYQDLLKSWGQDPNNVHLNKDQKAAVMRGAQASGVQVDEGNIEVDPSGNFNPKGHKLRNTLVVAGLAAATLATMGAAGAFAGAGGATGMAGGAAGAGAAGAGGAGAAGLGYGTLFAGTGVGAAGAGAAAPLAAAAIGTGAIPAIGSAGGATAAGGTGAGVAGGAGTAVTTAGKAAAKAASGAGMDWSDIALLAAQVGGGALKGLTGPKTGSFADGSDTDPRNIMKYGLDQTKGLFEGLKNNLAKGIDLRSSYAQDVPGLSGSDAALKNPGLLHLDGINFGGSPNMGGANGQGRMPSPAATPIGMAIPKPGVSGANGGNDSDKAMAALKLMGHA